MAPQSPRPSINPMAVDCISGLNASVSRHPMRQFALTEIRGYLPEKILDIPMSNVDDTLLFWIKEVKYRSPTSIVSV